MLRGCHAQRRCNLTGATWLSRRPSLVGRSRCAVHIASADLRHRVPDVQGVHRARPQGRPPARLQHVQPLLRLHVPHLHPQVGTLRVGGGCCTGPAGAAAPGGASGSGAGWQRLPALFWHCSPAGRLPCAHQALPSPSVLPLGCTKPSLFPPLCLSVPQLPPCSPLAPSQPDYTVKPRESETYDIYLVPPGEDPDTCQSWLRMRYRDGRYNLMFEEWVVEVSRGPLACLVAVSHTGRPACAGLRPATCCSLEVTMLRPSHLLCPRTAYEPAGPLHHLAACHV